MKKISRFFSMLFITGLLLWAVPFFNIAISAPPEAIDALEITKSDGLEQVIAGDGATHTYTIRVRNTDDDRARGVEVTDTWPAGFTRGQITPSRGTCTVLSTGFICNIGGLGEDDQETITVNYTVPAGTAAGDYTNVAVVTDDEFGEIVTASDVTRVITEADVQLVSKTDNPDPVYSGNILTYRLTVANHGPSNASAVELTDTLPGGTAYDDGLSTTACRSGATQGTVICPLGTIAAGSERQVEIKVHVTSSAAGTILNTASVASSTSDPNTNNNDNSTSTTVIVDVVKPVVTWTEPVLGEGEHLYVFCRPDCEIIPFSVEASDDIGVQKVRFYRWDHVIMSYVEIGEDFTNPYTWEFDPSALPPGINQIFVEAYDLSGQLSDRKRILLDKWLERFMPIIRN